MGGVVFSSLVGGSAQDSSKDSHQHFDGHSHVQQPCQDSSADHDSGDMDPEERAYHERFMREAINMVNHPRRQPLNSPTRDWLS